MMTLEEFAYRCRWLEHIRLRAYLSEPYARLHLRGVLRACRRGDSGLLRRGQRTAWTAMVESWYASYLAEGRPGGG